jgi:molybdopterin/thiamine biosynthesis adenylyltransferase
MRFSSKDFQSQREHLAASGDDESFAYALCSKAEGSECDIYICKLLILPGADDLKNQSHASVEPTQEFLAIVYGLAHDLGLIVIDIHTHPFSTNACFSSIDDHHGIRNAKYISENFPEGSTMGMLVLGQGLDNFEARMWNNEGDCFEPANRLEILGSPTNILTNPSQSRIEPDDTYARHRIIPGWQQGLLEKLNVFVCGLGGNGSLVFAGCVSLGIGTKGWLRACDPDKVEDSNLPRIPYAYPDDVGKSKAGIAQIYAKRKAPDCNISCYEDSIESDLMQSLIKEANIIFGAIDNDGARSQLNGLAARHMISYIDLGTEIIPEGSAYEAIGQVQVFLPGKTGCLVCSGAIDPSGAALDMMTDEENAQYENVGYVRGTSETPTPSVMHLNGVISHLAISQLLRLIFDDGIGGKEYLHYNRQNANLLAASVMRNDDCPVCGTQGYLGAGDENERILEDLSDLQDSKAFEQL